MSPIKSPFPILPSPVFSLTTDLIWLSMKYILNQKGIMKIEKISWDQETVDHISNHLVSPEEVEEVLFNDMSSPLIMRGKEGKYLAYGKTDGGRFLLVVWAAKYRKTKIITARDMSKKEKQFYKRRRK